MEKSVKTIGKRKWISLSARQKHTAITKFANYCIINSNLDEFLLYYEKLMLWDPIDKFYPPKWLEKTESLELFFSFHQKLSGKPIHYYKKTTNELEDVIWNPKNKISIILDQVLTPYNVGSILRVIDNFGFSELIHSTKGFDPLNSNLKRAAMGSEQWIPIKYVQDLPEFLNSSKIPSFALEKTTDSLPIMEWRPPETPFNIIIGNEAFGVSEQILDLCKAKIHIPMEGYKNSMNLSHAFAIISFYITNYF